MKNITIAFTSRSLNVQLHNEIKNLYENYIGETAQNLGYEAEYLGNDIHVNIPRRGMKVAILITDDVMYIYIMRKDDKDLEDMDKLNAITILGNILNLER